jgi:hypothetical protein
MTTATRQAILRADAIFLLLIAAGGLWMDVLAIVFADGPQSRVIASAPLAGMGFLEAHGLALIIGILLWRADPLRSWHITAVAVHVILGMASLMFRQIFIVAGILAAGYAMTSLHFLFVVIQLFAASTAATRAPSQTQF